MTTITATRPRAASAPRTALAVAHWVFVAALVAQIYLAGVFLMWEGEALSWHEGVGYLLTYYPIIALVFAVFARMPRRYWASFAMLFLALQVQPILVHLSPEDAGWARALHPVNAVLILALAFQLARMASASRKIDRS